MSAGFLFLAGAYLPAAACVGDDAQSTSTKDDAAVAETGPTDSPSSSDAPAEAAADAADAADAAVPACDLGKPFGTPGLVPGGGINTVDQDDAFWPSPDLLSVFVSTTRFVDGSAGGYDIFYGTRTSPDASFEMLLPAVSLNSAVPERNPVLTADGKTIYFSRYSGTFFETFTSTRNSTTVAFDPPQVVAAPVDGPTTDLASWVSPDGSRLYFASDRPGSAGLDIYVAARAGVGGAFTTPVAIPSLNSAGDESGLVLSSNELQAVFSSSRSGGATFYASRASVSAGFSTPTPITELTKTDYPTWLSADGCTLYFSSTTRAGRIGGYDVFVTTRGK